MWFLCSNYTFCNPGCSNCVDVYRFCCLRHFFSEDSDGVWGPENGPGVQKCVDVAFLGSGRGGLYTGPKFRVRKCHFYKLETQCSGGPSFWIFGLPRAAQKTCRRRIGAFVVARVVIPAIITIAFGVIVFALAVTTILVDAAVVALVVVLGAALVVAVIVACVVVLAFVVTSAIIVALVVARMVVLVVVRVVVFVVACVFATVLIPVRILARVSVFIILLVVLLLLIVARGVCFVYLCGVGG